MRLILFVMAAIAVFSVVGAQGQPKAKSWFIFLETGKPTPADAEAVTKMQMGHLANFTRLFNEKKLFAAGPLADPEKVKRGIVVVEAATKEELMTYFQPDDYVREGYMKVNAAPCQVQKALNTAEIDPNAIEEVRIVQITRPAVPLTKEEQKASHAYLKAMVDRGDAGAWYSLETGDISEILFFRSTDSDDIAKKFIMYPPFKAANVKYSVWKQWLGKGVVK